MADSELAEAMQNAITVAQRRVLAWLCDNPGSSARQVGKATRISTATTRSLLGSLQNQGLVYHEVHQTIRFVLPTYIWYCTNERIPDVEEV